MRKEKLIKSKIRTFVLSLVLIVLLSPLVSVISFAQTEEITFSVVLPEGYVTKKDLSKLSRSINIPLETTFYKLEGDEELDFSKYEASADIIIARNYQIEEAMFEEKFTELDHSLILNKGFINQQFINSAYDQGRKYSIPITWGSIGILYRKDKFDKPPATWRWLLDSDKYSGRVALIGDGRTLIQIALKYIGISANTNDPSWINQAEGLLKRQKPHIKNFGSDDGIALILADKVDLAIATNEEAIEVMKKDKNIGFSFPREGSLIWHDIVCISSNSNNLESAHYFINAILDAEIGKSIAENNNLATTNIMSYELLKDSNKKDSSIYPETQIIDRFEDTSIMLDFDYEMMIDEMWDNILDS